MTARGELPQRCIGLIREISILLTLERSRYGLTVDEMAERHGVCGRTIRRDLQALESAGVPLVQEDGRRWRALNWRDSYGHEGAA